MKSRWLWKVTTWRPLKFGLWGNRDPKNRPTRWPKRVLKLFNKISGTCEVGWPWPAISLPETKFVTLKNAVGPAGRWDTIAPLQILFFSLRTWNGDCSILEWYLECLDTHTYDKMSKSSFRCEFTYFLDIVMTSRIVGYIRNHCHQFFHKIVQLCGRFRTRRDHDVRNLSSEKIIWEFIRRLICQYLLIFRCYNSFIRFTCIVECSRYLICIMFWESVDVKKKKRLPVWAAPYLRVPLPLVYVLLVSPSWPFSFPFLIFDRLLVVSAYFLSNWSCFRTSASCDGQFFFFSRAVSLFLEFWGCERCTCWDGV